MPRERKNYDADFKTSAIHLAQKETVPIAAAKLGIKPALIYYWREMARKQSGNDAPAASASGGRVMWTDEELSIIAAEFVNQRCADPFGFTMPLFEKAQRKLPGGRQRNIPGIQSSPPLVKQILKQWKARLNPPVVDLAPAPPPEPLPAPPAQVITLEVPRKMTADEMLANIDEPTLEALLAAKRIARETQFQEILRAIVVQAGNAALPPVKQFVPKFEAFHDGQNKKRRIAVVGLPVAEHDALTAEIKDAQLNAVMSYPDGKDRETISRCDFAVICRDPAKTINLSESDRAIGSLGRERCVLLDSVERRVIVQRVRDILSRQ